MMLSRLLSIFIIGLCSSLVFGASNKTGFRKDYLTPIGFGDQENVLRAQVTYVPPQGGKEVQYILLEKNPAPEVPKKKRLEEAAAMKGIVDGMLNFEPTRKGVDLTQRPFPGVTFGKKQQPKPSQVNCFGYAVMSSLGQGNAGFEGESFWLESGFKVDLTRKSDPYRVILKNFYESKGVLGLEKFDQLATNKDFLPGDIVSLSSEDGRDIHAGVLVQHGDELWVRNKLGETEYVLEVPLERLLINYKDAKKAEVFRPKKEIVRDPMIHSITEPVRASRPKENSGTTSGGGGL